jgi:hypothetical protein
VDSPKTPVLSPELAKANPSTPMPSVEAVCPKSPYAISFAAQDTAVKADEPGSEEVLERNKPSKAMPLQDCPK